MIDEDYDWYAGDDEIEAIAKDDRFKELIAEFVNTNVTKALIELSCPGIYCTVIDGEPHICWYGPDVNGESLGGKESIRKVVTAAVYDNCTESGPNEDARRIANCLIQDLESITIELRELLSK